MVPAVPLQILTSSLVESKSITLKSSGRELPHPHSLAGTLSSRARAARLSATEEGLTEPSKAKRGSLCRIYFRISIEKYHVSLGTRR